MAASVDVTVASWLALDRCSGLHRLRQVEAVEAVCEDSVGTDGGEWMRVQAEEVAVLTEAVASIEVTVASWRALDRPCSGLHRL